ncbi:MAG: sigma-70 family RNA polymerase sigma factor [Clostridium sulfidigenes]|uniref:Sigma-70 family RNA polymerase sigma factor n=1 Tax=Clostridium sulfidigenes TaxID=318464 RepID=A0A927WAE3_9CLOT|nr:sigma-70 family RNA polymerase sigma factor [Clostridium sulfidigenes]
MELNNEELVREYQEGSKQALEKLIEQNMGIIKKIAGKYSKVCTRGIEFDDLFQSGAIGLINAAKIYKFDLDNKAKFITYASHYINRWIYRCANGRSEKDIANTKFYNSCKSLNTPINSDGESEDEIGNFIECKDYGFENVIENEFHKLVRIELEEVMNECLTLREREVLKFLYGWECNIMNNEEVSEVLSITKSGVRQIRKNALRKIRNTSWWRTKGKFYAYEIKGLIYAKKEDVELSYREVEKDNHSIETIKGYNFINRYFDDLMGV